MIHSKRPVLFLLACACGFATGWAACTGQTPLVIDFNPDNGRNDVVTKGTLNWPIGSTAKSQQTIGNVTISVAAEGGPESELEGSWWKAGFDFPAALVSDGVSTRDPGHTLRVTISGLPPGRHSITTWHNHVDADSPKSIDIELNGQTQRITPTHRVTHDDDAANAHFAFEQTGDAKIEMVLRSAPDQRVILSALAVDTLDPALQIAHATPVDGEEHCAESPRLSWKAPRQATERDAYQVYVGTDPQRVEQADTDAPEFLAKTSDLFYPVTADDPLKDNFWRVDLCRVDGSVVKGIVRRFKIRALAFPTAEGYGRFASGGRGGRVIEVTNLDDSGPGSLRAAIEAEGARTIVFRVAGTIALKSKLVIRNPYVTIAGQTAPGDGICVRGYTFGCFGTHDVIMRYLRIRVGDESGETMDGTGFASTDHAIYDHCSISWSIDEAVSSRGAKNITLQRCLIGEALNIANHRKYQAGKGHSFAASISGDIGSFHHNLLVHCAGRNWSLAGGLNRGGKFAGRLDIRNNVVYNWQHRTNDGGVKALNLVNNLYLPGPTSKVFHLLKPDVGSPEDPQQYYVAGNSMPGKFTAEGDNWRDAVQAPAGSEKQIKLEQPFCESFVKTHSTSELLENILADVGANHAGADAVDARLIDEVRHGRTTFQGVRSQLAGIIDSQTDVGGWPELKPGEPVLDSDHDGMEDNWERRHGLDPNRVDSNQPIVGGPTALELYLNSIPQRFSSTKQ